VQYLQENYHYTLSNAAPRGGQDPVIVFLFDHRQGHCELFAAALTALTRSLGIPARVITGYRASEYNHVGGYYVVRKSHAHAWTEIDGGPGVGWRVFDATPSQTVSEEHTSSRTWLTTFREFYEHVEFAWISSVVAYDQRTQQSVMKGLNESLGTASKDQQTWLGTVFQSFRSLSQLWRLDRVSYSIADCIIIVIAVGLVSLVRTLLVRHRRLVALQLTSLPHGKRRGLARKLRFYLLMLDILERHGYVRPPRQSPFAFAEELAEADPMRFSPIVILTELFYEIRFGHRELTENRRQRIRKELRLLEEALSQRKMQAS
jgi:hypothetical protein